MIKELSSSGLNHAEIARRLKESGYKSPRTGKAISSMGVGYHIRKLTDENEEPVRRDIERPTPTLSSPADPDTWKRRIAKNPTTRKVQLAQEILTSELSVRDKCEVVAAILMS